jgi:hypothetical protein
MILSYQEDVRDSGSKKCTFLASVGKETPALVSTYVRNIRRNGIRRLCDITYLFLTSHARLYIDTTRMAFLKVE